MRAVGPVTDSLLTYLSVAFFLVITPGATTAVVIQETVRHGHRAGAAAAAGAALGNGVHALLAGLGVAVLLRQWPAVSGGLRIAGGLYLIWLALSTLRRALPDVPALPARHAAGRPSRSSLREGWLVTMINPAAPTFYLTVVPGFVAPGAGPAAFAGLAALHITMAFTCHLGWATAFDRLRRVLTRPGALRLLDAVAGAALFVLGVTILAG